MPRISIYLGPFLGLDTTPGLFERSNKRMIWYELLLFPIGQPLVRMSLPAKPNLSNHNLRGDDEYAELSSRFKGSHVKILLWWLTMETRVWADATPNGPSRKIETYVYEVFSKHLLNILFGIPFQEVQIVCFMVISTSFNWGCSVASTGCVLLLPPANHRDLRYVRPCAHERTSRWSFQMPGRSFGCICLASFIWLRTSSYEVQITLQEPLSLARFLGN